VKQASVTTALEQNGFVIVPAELDRFYYAYQGNEYEGWPVYVTTDVAYHEWHLVFDKLLRTLEQQVLLPKLETLGLGLAPGRPRAGERAQGQFARRLGLASGAALRGRGRRAGTVGRAGPAGQSR